MSSSEDEPAISNDDTDQLRAHDSDRSSLEEIHGLRLRNPFNPLIAYLNINSLRYKIVDLREVVSKFAPDYFVISETKLDESFPSRQMEIDDYEIRNRLDRNGHGGGLIEYVKKGL